MSVMWKRLSLVLCLCCGTGWAHAQAPAILVMGDSLSAAYGIAVDRGWVALLREKLEREGYPHRVINASISGETTAGGLRRLPQALRDHRPSLVLIELGANDGLRGLPLTSLQNNLASMIQLSRQSGAKAVLFEMRIPSNYGPTYTDGFQTTFRRIAKKAKTPLIPFWMAGIATESKWFLDDGIHPNEAAQPQLLDAVWPTLKPLLSKP